MIHKIRTKGGMTSKYQTQVQSRSRKRKVAANTVRKLVWTLGWETRVGQEGRGLGSPWKEAKEERCNQLMMQFGFRKRNS